MHTPAKHNLATARWWPGLLASGLACSAAYAIHHWLRPWLPRLGQHLLYFVWIALLGTAVFLWMRTVAPGYLRRLWAWVYGLGMAYLAGVESISFLSGELWKKYLQSSIAHTAFLLSSPLPLIIFFCIYQWQRRQSASESLRL